MVISKMAGALRRNRRPVWGSEQRVGIDLVNNRSYLLTIALRISFKVSTTFLKLSFHLFKCLLLFKLMAVAERNPPLTC